MTFDQHDMPGRMDDSLSPNGHYSDRHVYIARRWQNVVRRAMSSIQSTPPSLLHTRIEQDEDRENKDEGKSGSLTIVVTEPTTLTSFPKFPELLPELRLKIWKTALRASRDMIAVKAHEVEQTIPPEHFSIAETLEAYTDTISGTERNGPQLTRENRRYSFYYLSTTQPQPPLLHVNHESECEAKKRFKLIECSIDLYEKFGKSIPDHPRPLMDAKCDRLWFSHLRTTSDYDIVHWAMMHTCLMTKIKFRSIAIPWEFFQRVIRSASPYSDITDNLDPVLTLAHKFFTMVRAVGLEELVVILGAGDSSNYNASFSEPTSCQISSSLDDYLREQPFQMILPGPSFEMADYNFTCAVGFYHMETIGRMEKEINPDPKQEALRRDMRAWNAPLVILRHLN